MIMKCKVYEDLVMTFLEESTTNETLFTGLASETGEVMSERMHEVRHGKEKTEEILDELSDVLFYVVTIANRRGSNLKQLMTHSIVKLEDRALNGKR